MRNLNENASMYRVTCQAKACFCFLRSQFSLGNTSAHRQIRRPFVGLPRRGIVPQEALPQIPLLNRHNDSRFRLRAVTKYFFVIIRNMRRLVRPIAHRDLRRVAIARVANNRPITITFCVHCRVVGRHLSIVNKGRSRRRERNVTTLTSHAVLADILIVGLPVRYFVGFFARVDMVYCVVPVVRRAYHLRRVTGGRVVVNNDCREGEHVAEGSNPRVSVVVPVARSREGSSVVNANDRVVGMATRSIVMFSGR